MIIMPVRAEAPVNLVAANEAQATPANNTDNPPPEAEQPTDTAMPDTNGANHGASKPTAAATSENPNSSIA